MLEIDPHDWLKLPRYLYCPECGGRLYLDVFEWETDTRKVTHAGFHIECITEDSDNPDTWHRHWQGEWQDIENIIWLWLCKFVRVRADE